MSATPITRAEPPARPPLPMLAQLPMDGATHGNRSAVTCHLKCADACFHPVPNTSANPSFRDVAQIALSRRQAMGLAGAGALALLVGPAALGTGTRAAAATANHPAVARSSTQRGLTFTPIKPVGTGVDTVTVPDGYQWQTLIRWGDPILPGGVPFDATTQTGASQALQFGYNNDYLDILRDPAGRSAILVANNEYVNPELMFPPSIPLDEQKRISMAAHGMSVVDLTRRKKGEPWTYRPDGEHNRRITAMTPFTLTGPAAGSELVRTAADPSGRTVLGTFGNCSGGTTPWGTILSGEENFQGYFVAKGTPEEARYGLANRPSTYGWESIEQRFDSTKPGYEHEPNRFGYIVEVDPTDPTSTPRKHTSLGRFKHEGANIHLARDGRAVAYMGDDERFDYLYKFVSTNSMRKGRRAKDRAHNLTLLEAGDLYVARFSGDSPPAQIDGTGTPPADGAFDGSGTWLPLVLGGVSQINGMTVEQVLVYTRLAADKAGATKMDRCEDVQPNSDGRVYVACTNNTDRGVPGKKEAATEVNPRNANKDGHVIEIAEDRRDAASTSFTWTVLLVCGDPAKDSNGYRTYFAGFPAEKVSPISCPDNLAFDGRGNLWIATDGAPSAIGYSDGLYKVPLTGKERGHVQQFLAVPAGAETCGPVIHDDEGLVFVAAQHPGEDGTYASPRSYFPDFVPPGNAAPAGQFAGPRPSVIQVFGS